MLGVILLHDEVFEIGPDVDLRWVRLYLLDSFIMVEHNQLLIASTARALLLDLVVLVGLLHGAVSSLHLLW